MADIVIISPGFPVDENDTACLPFLQVYLLKLQERYPNITVITQQYPAGDNYTWNGIEVITLRKKEPVLFSKLLLNYRLLKVLRFIHTTKKIQAIHNFWFAAFVLTVNRFTTRLAIPHITTFAGQDALPTNPSLSRINSYKGELICPSAFQAKQLLAHTTVQVKIIGFGTEPPPAIQKPKTIDLIFCGFISPLKNYGQFVEIVHELAKTQSVQKVVMCGGGDGLKDLSEKVKLMGLETIVDIKGSIGREQALELMQQSRILVHTSTYESFGMVLAEALGFNCVVISKPVGIAYDDTNIIRCNSTAEFTEQIKKALSAPASQKTPPYNYPVSATVDAYLPLYGL